VLAAELEETMAPRPSRAARAPWAPADDREPRATLRNLQGEVPRARGERTRRRITEAALALLGELDRPPTAQEVARRAGVTSRLLFHHFRDLDALYRSVVASEIGRYRSGVDAIPPDLPLDERVDRTVRKRAALYGSMGHLGQNAGYLSTRHESIAQGVVQAHAALRDRLEHTFSPELEAAGRKRRELLAAVDVAVSWQLWDCGRRVEGLSAAATRRLMTRMLTAALAG
jgi:AcrR family transcriptional regulator